MQMTPEEQAFRRDIIENPEDDAIRLIFADWLEDQGDSYADLIRVQCQLAKMDEFDDNYAELKVQEYRSLQLLKDRLPEEATTRRSRMSPPVLRRGFQYLSPISAAKKYRASIEEKYLWEPIEKVSLRAFNRDEKKDVFDWPFLSRVREISTDVGYRGEILRHLLTSPWLTQLKVLNLRTTHSPSTGIEDRGVGCIGRSMSNSCQSNQVGLLGLWHR